MKTEDLKTAPLEVISVSEIRINLKRAKKWLNAEKIILVISYTTALGYFLPLIDDPENLGTMDLISSTDMRNGLSNMVNSLRELNEDKAYKRDCYGITTNNKVGYYFVPIRTAFLLGLNTVSISIPEEN